MESAINLADNEFITFKNSQGVSARGTLLKISQNHIVFETYNPYSIVQLSEVLSNVTICRFRETAYVGKAVVSNLINTGLLLVVSATLVDPWLDKIKPNKFGNIEDEIKKLIDDWRVSNFSIIPEYQVAVNNIRSFLSDLNRWIRQFENITYDDDSFKDEQSLIEKISPPLIQNLGELIVDFEVEVKKVEPSLVGVSKRFTQQELHPFVMQSSFGHRVFHKPLGYAGDYEMVNMMLRSPYEGETTYAKLLNLFLLGTGPAEAHRNRIDILFDKIKETALKAKGNGRRAQIFNFACGPAAEIQRFIEKEEISNNCDFILLDFSKETLDYTKSKIDLIVKEKNRSGVSLKYVNKSVNDVLRNAIGLRDSTSDELKNFDLVYCAGLFDYLSNKICSKMLGLFITQLRQDGELLATNVHSRNPVRGMMEHIFEWYLIYRNDEEFEALLDVKHKKVYADKTGFNIFLEARLS